MKKTLSCHGDMLRHGKRHGYLSSDSIVPGRLVLVITTSNQHKIERAYSISVSFSSHQLQKMWPVHE
eukprot:scaffold70300_cov23-Cyclotella_meneghiniana.AAC.1